MPAGSAVTVRVLANTPLKYGFLTWEDGTRQPLTPDPKRPRTAWASFEIKKDTTYNFAVTDIDEQRAESVGLAYVRALADKAPSICAT